MLKYRVDGLYPTAGAFIGTDIIIFVKLLVTMEDYLDYLGDSEAAAVCKLM